MNISLNPQPRPTFHFFSWRQVVYSRARARVCACMCTGYGVVGEVFRPIDVHLCAAAALANWRSLREYTPSRSTAAFSRLGTPHHAPSTSARVLSLPSLVSFRADSIRRHVLLLIFSARVFVAFSVVWQQDTWWWHPTSFFVVSSPVCSVRFQVARRKRVCRFFATMFKHI